MAVELSKEIQDAIKNPGTVKALATIDKNGVPYVVYKGSLHVNEEGNIEINEILESSRNNQNLVYAIWFDKLVSVNLLTPEKKSYQLHLKPVKCITSGAYFESIYNSVREGGRDIDLGAVWQFEVVGTKEETFQVRVKEDEEKYPLLKHLDRLTKQE